MIYTIQLEVDEDVIDSCKKLYDILDDLFFNNRYKGIYDYEIMNAFRFKEF